ncbi:MAG: helix-turn-helix domain-containing protein [Bacillota bacterium]
MLDVEKIRELREKAGLTQQQAAELAKLKSRQHWNEIESGRQTNITMDTLERIASALGVKAKGLLK